MDLSFRFPDPAAADQASAADLSGAVAGVGEDGATVAAPSAAAPSDLLAPNHGAFSATMAASLLTWKQA